MIGDSEHRRLCDAECELARAVALLEQAYHDQPHPGSVLALVLLDEIRRHKPNYPARDASAWAAARAGR